MRTHASIFLCAQSGMGKSYLATYLLLKINAKRKYVIDYTGEYVLRGFTKVVVTRDNYTALPKLLEKYDRIVFDLNLVGYGNVEKIVDYISHYALYQRNTLILYEECHEYIDKNVPQQYIRMVATGGRKFGVSSIFVSQRPSLLNTTIRSQTNIKIAGKMTDPRDIDAVKSLFTNWYLIPKLKPRVFLYRDYTGEEFLFTTENLVLPHQG